MTKKKMTKEYINECIQLGYDLPIEQYIKCDTKIKHRCNKCGFVYLPEQKVLIEYQGAQHYESIRFRGARKKDKLAKAKIS